MSSISFFSSGPREIVGLARGLSNFGRKRKAQYEDTIDPVLKHSIDAIWNQHKNGGELRINAKDRLYVLPKEEGFFWIFQRIANVFKQLWVEKWELSNGHNKRCTILCSQTIQQAMNSLPVRNYLFYTIVLEELPRVMAFYNKAFRDQECVESFSEKAPNTEKFLGLMEQWESLGMRWEITPSLGGVQAAHPNVKWLSLIHRYIFQPNGNLRFLWIMNEDGNMDGRYTNYQK
ncbi:MAG TPA: hypothetical protein VGM34_03780 [Chlamydiales bacterium]